jgi:flavin reductase (DIM6/NTAB) family NADH-FMN oxidoreductase RutF
MHYLTATNQHGLRHDPFKAIVSPRPIGWIASVGEDGGYNLAPYSFFNAVSDDPHMVMFASSGRKDTLSNVQRTGEFTCSLATHSLVQAMNLSSAAVRPEVDEFALTGLTPAPSMAVKAPRVAQSPVALECRVWKTLDLPAPARASHAPSTVVFGEVVAIYINESVLRDGRIEMNALSPVARLGYMDYAVINAANLFTQNRPSVSADGLSATVDDKPWDGVYR